MNSSHVAEEYKMKLKQVHDSLNPVALSKLEKKVRTQIDKAWKSLKAGNINSSLLAPPKIPTNTITDFRLSHSANLPTYKTGT